MGFDSTTNKREGAFSSEKLDKFGLNPYFRQNFFSGFATHFHEAIHVGPGCNQYAYTLKTKPSKSQMDKFINGISSMVDSMVMMVFTIMHFLETSQANSDGRLVHKLVEAPPCYACIDEVYSRLCESFCDLLANEM